MSQGTKATLIRVNHILDSMETILKCIESNQNVEINTEKDRQSYKDGLVDGLCMMSWNRDKNDNNNDVDDSDITDYVGKDLGDKSTKLSDMLVEIGSVYGFDGEAELKRVKTDEMDGMCNGDKINLKEVTDDDIRGVEEIAGNDSDE